MPFKVRDWDLKNTNNMRVDFKALNVPLCTVFDWAKRGSVKGFTFTHSEVVIIFGLLTVPFN
jgi:hypothetical protein